jgi:UDP-N-acetyl-2-amino-2-deoxyglucuronate dehydrogenase
MIVTLQNMKVKFAVVGCGSIGKRHIAVLDADPNVEIVGICDIEITRVQELSALYNNIPFFTNFEELLASCKADVVNIVTPHALHKAQSIQALNHGFHVLVEKPMSLNVQDAREMNEAATANGKKLWVVKQNRFNVPVSLTHKAIRSGWLGRIFMVKCDVLWNRYQGYYDDSSWRGKLQEEGGALFTQASHFIDLLIWWCGEVKSVKAKAATQNHNIETEDSGVAVMEFENGALGSLTWTTCVYEKNYEGSITVIGEKGTIKIGGAYLNKIEFWNVENQPLPTDIDFNDKPNAYGKYQGTSSNHDKVISSIVKELQTGIGQNVEGTEGLRSIDAIEKIYANILQ